MPLDPPNPPPAPKPVATPGVPATRPAENLYLWPRVGVSTGAAKLTLLRTPRVDLCYSLLTTQEATIATLDGLPADWQTPSTTHSGVAGACGEC